MCWNAVTSSNSDVTLNCSIRKAYTTPCGVNKSASAKRSPKASNQISNCVDYYSTVWVWGGAALQRCDKAACFDAGFSRRGHSAGQTLDRLHRFRRQRQVAALEILPHVLRAGGSGQRQNPNTARKTKDDLRRSSVSNRTYLGNQRMMHHFPICRQQRKSLVDDFVLAAELAHITIPSQTSVAAVLHKRWQLRARAGHLLQVL